MNDLAHSPAQGTAGESLPGGPPALSPLEIEVLFEAVFQRYDIDFRRYSVGYLLRRVARGMSDEKVLTVAELQARVLADPAAMQRLLNILTIHTTSLFRDPEFHLSVRSVIVPWLRTYPFIRIWIAGCSTGEEAYSLAILLHEEGLSARCRIYATDFNEAVLARARAGIFPLPLMREYAANYRAAGGRSTLSDYYVEDGHNAIMTAPLREGIVFAQHNLVCDGSFNEFHVVFCRNVLIYFSRELQARAHELMWKSLVHLGFLGLGSSESIAVSPHQAEYEEISGKTRIYRKITPR